MSLKNKLFRFYTIVFLLPVVIFLSLNIWTSYSNTLEKSHSSATYVLGQISSNIDVLLNSAVNISRMVVSNALVQEYYRLPDTPQNEANRFSLDAQIRVFMGTITEPRNTVDSVAIYTPNDDNILCNELSTTTAYNRYYTQDGVETLPDMVFQDNWGHEVAIDIHEIISRTGEIEYISVLTPLISTSSGLRSGFVQVNIDKNTIGSLYDNVELENGSEIIFTSYDGQVLLGNADSAVFQDLLQEGRFTSILSQLGESKIVPVGDALYYVTSVPYDNLGWIAMSIVPMEEIVLPIVQQVILFILFLLISVTAFFLCTRHFLIRITNPIDQLITSMEGAAQGDLTSYVECKGHDEIAKLSHAFNEMIHQISDLIEDVYAAEIENKESQLMLLQAQINPHFLYNTLEGIRALLLFQDYPGASDLVINLENYYRSSLNQGKSVISLKEELANVSHYLQIQKYRYREKLTYMISCSPDLEQCSIIKMSIQPLVENAIYHGIRQLVDSGYVHIHCHVKNDALWIDVLDNGPGFSSCTSEAILSKNSSSFGLYNVNQRIVLRFGGEYGIHIAAPGSGTCVSIKLPIRYNP